MYKIFLIFFVSFLMGQLMFSCGGTRQDDSAQEQQQQELDEIEALLGISKDESTKKENKQQEQKQKDQLGLLESGSLGSGQALTPDQKKIQDLEKENSTLKSQVSQKELIISDLKAQIKLQSDRISELETSKSARGYVSSGGSYNVSVGDISADEYSQKYDEAYNLFNSHEYDAALAIFESLLASSGRHSLSDNAQYWVGEVHYAKRQFSKAIIDFEKVFTFPNSNKLDDAQFKLGLCYVQKGDKVKAREEFQRLLDLYPNSEYVSRAKKHLETL